MPWTGKDVVVRDSMDPNPLGVKQILICHRNLDFEVRAVDSNERELTGAAHLKIKLYSLFNQFCPYFTYG
jgi:hypothetical protein